MLSDMAGIESAAEVNIGVENHRDNCTAVLVWKSRCAPRA